MIKEQKLLYKRIQESKGNEFIIIDDLVPCCKNINQLIEITLLAWKKGISLKSIKQPWFNSNNQGENQLITLVRLSQLEKLMNSYWEDL